MSITWIFQRVASLSTIKGGINIIKSITHTDKFGFKKNTCEQS